MWRFARNGRVENYGPVGCIADGLDKWSDTRLHGFRCLRMFEYVDQGNKPDQSTIIFHDGDCTDLFPFDPEILIKFDSATQSNLRLPLSVLSRIEFELRAGSHDDQHTPCVKAAMQILVPGIQLAR